MLNAMSRATDEDREVLRSTHLDPSLSDEQKIARVKAIYDKYNIPHMIKQQIALRFDRAISILSTLDIDASRTEHLRLFAQNLMERKK
jgi:geranylgeranyl diphosphate synthase type II